jgi:hypothetical protein
MTTQSFLKLLIGTQIFWYVAIPIAQAVTPKLDSSSQGGLSPVSPVEEAITAQDLNRSLQVNFTTSDAQVLEDLVQTAVRNSADVREARLAIGIAPWAESVSLGVSRSSFQAEITDAIDRLTGDSGGSSSDSISVDIAVQPLSIIYGFLQQPALRSRFREARRQTRLAVIQGYVGYIQARQAARIAEGQLQQTTANAQSLQSLQATSSLLSTSSNLATNPEYVAAATETLEAKANELVALETLSAIVGLSPEDTLQIIDTGAVQK